MNNTRLPQTTFEIKMHRPTVTYGRKGSKRSRSNTGVKADNTGRSSLDRPKKRSRVSDEGSSASGDDNGKFSRQNILFQLISSLVLGNDHDTMTPAKAKASRSTIAPSPPKAPGGSICNSALPSPDGRDSEQT